MKYSFPPGWSRSSGSSSSGSSGSRVSRRGGGGSGCQAAAVAATFARQVHVAGAAGGARVEAGAAGAEFWAAWGTRDHTHPESLGKVFYKPQSNLGGDMLYLKGCNACSGYTLGPESLRVKKSLISPPLNVYMHSV